MKILLTGGSSFTGLWFIQALKNQGHEIIVILRTGTKEYTGLRRQRVELLQSLGVAIVENCSFGDQLFCKTIAQGFDVLCHHGAQVENYKNIDFNTIQAVNKNTLNAREVLQLGKNNGMKFAVLTGTVFEKNEGAGTQPLQAFSPYGLSKGLTWEYFLYWAEYIDLPLYKFVIPNPFGSYEDPRFCTYLMDCWSKGKSAQVNTPNYVRDNIHIELLAFAYADFIDRIKDGVAPKKFNPSGYIETQGDFAKRFSLEIGKRLNIAANLQIGAQEIFSEPYIRINTDKVNLSWNEGLAWDNLAEFYKKTYF